MDKVTLLKLRLEEIVNSLKNHAHGLGLLGLGSAGQSTNRMDEYSDLDFFAIVQEGHKQHFIDCLDWVANIQSIAWCFRNTVDGYKLLFSDGVFCEFAVFEPLELVHIPYASGRFIWRDDCLSEHLSRPKIAIPEQSQDEGFLLAELLTNLYVGLCRYRRGEKCSAMRFIQVYAFDRLLSLLGLRDAQGEEVEDDAFSIERRVEQRYPQYQQLFSQCTQGSEKCSESAEAMLLFVKKNYDVDSTLVGEINQLISFPS